MILSGSAIHFRYPIWSDLSNSALLATDGPRLLGLFGCPLAVNSSLARVRSSGR
jgi:hypothetical protein